MNPRRDIWLWAIDAGTPIKGASMTGTHLIVFNRRDWDTATKPQLRRLFRGRRRRRNLLPYVCVDVFDQRGRCTRHYNPL